MVRPMEGLGLLGMRQESVPPMPMRGLETSAAEAASPRGGLPTQESSRPCGATSAPSPTHRDACDGIAAAPAAVEGRVRRRVWSSVNLAVDDAPVAYGVASQPPPRASEGCSLQGAPQRPPLPLSLNPLPHRSICPRYAGNSWELAPRRHAPWSAEDARSQTLAAPRRRPATWYGHNRRLAPWYEMPHPADLCPACFRPTKLWDEVGGPPREMRTHAECNRREYDQHGNPERSREVLPWYDEERLNMRWDHTLRSLAQGETSDRIAMENRRRPSGDVGYCASEWGPDHVRRNAREYDLWDGLERGIRLSDNGDTQRSMNSRRRCLVGRRLLETYGIERENEAYRDTPQRPRYDTFGVLSEMVRMQSTLAVASGTNEITDTGSECVGSEILSHISSLETQNSWHAPTRENNILLAPPKNFSSCSNENVCHLRDSRESEQIYVENNDIGIRRSNSPDTQASSTIFTKFQTECKASVSCGREIPVRNTFKKNITTTLGCEAGDESKTSILKGGAQEEQINIRSSTSNTSEVRADVYTPLNNISRGVNTSVIEVTEKKASFLGNELVQDSNDTRQSIDRMTENEYLPLDSFKAAWNMVEQLNILQHSIENHSRSDNTDLQDIASFQTNPTQFLAPEEVPDVVDAAWKVIKFSGMYKSDIEKHKGLLSESEHLPQCREAYDKVLGPELSEPARNVPGSSKITNHDSKIHLDKCDLKRNSNLEGRVKSSTEIHSQESFTIQKKTSKSARCRSCANSVSPEPKLLSAAWNVVKTTSAFKDELDRLRRLSDDLAKAGIATDESSSPTPSISNISRKHKGIENLDTSKRNRKKQIIEKKIEVSQVTSLHGEQAMPSVKNRSKTFQRGQDGEVKLEECKNLTRKNKKISDETEGNIIKIVDCEKGRNSSNLTDSIASTMTLKERIFENHMKREQISVDLRESVNCNTEIRRHEFTPEVKVNSFGNNSKLSNVHMQPNAGSSCLKIRLMPSCGKNSENEVKKQEEKKKVHFKILRKQNKSTDIRVNEDAPSVSLNCSKREKGAAQREEITFTSKTAQPIVRDTSLQRSYVREDLKSGNINTHTSGTNLHSISFINNVGRRSIASNTSDLPTNQPHKNQPQKNQQQKNNTMHLDVRTVGTSTGSFTKNESLTIQKGNRVEKQRNIMATSQKWRNTGVQTNIHKG